jgi:23S rRNA (pseudouridine1915-N3)-methyltransferase
MHDITKTELYKNDKYSLTSPMKIVILCVDKTRKSWLSEGEKEYMMKLRKHNCEVKFEILEPVKNKEKSKIIDFETERISEILLQYRDYVKTILNPQGVSVTSEEFAHKIVEKSISTKGNLLFVIGGSDGLNYEKLSTLVDFQVSFSKMIFLHEMIRVFLLEQLFRGFEILKDGEYHK